MACMLAVRKSCTIVTRVVYLLHNVYTTLNTFQKIQMSMNS